jgi:SAM-dependent methyltransferase
LRLSDAERTRYRMMAAAAREQEAELWRRAGIVEGARVADVGCGPGAVLAEIARIVAPTGRAVGIEPGEAARDAAREELDALGLSDVEVRDGAGDATGLERGAWDCVMVRHVLMHTTEAEDIVSHLATLLAPGGHLYLVDTDLDALRVSPHDPDIEEQQRRYAAFHRSRGSDPRLGSQLGSVIRAAGLEVIENRGFYRCIPASVAGDGGPLRAAQEAMLASGDLSPEEVERWEAARRRLAGQPDAEVWVPLFIAIGRVSP